MNLSATIEIPDHVIAREVMGEMVLLDLGSGTYFGLDPVGARIWELAGSGKDLACVADTILEEYKASREQVEGDILRLVGELRERDLVRLARTADEDP